MNSVQIFKDNQFGEIRVIKENGEILFVANDIANALGYSNPSKASKDHCKHPSMRWGNDSLGRSQQFKVIPTIGKTGGYVNNTSQFTDFF